MSVIDTLLHPVRWRIVQALGAGPLATRDIHALMPDVAQATLYRHVSSLVEVGLIDVVEERQARGAVERTYALAGPMSADSDDPAAFRRGFLHVLALLHADLERVALEAEKEGGAGPRGLLETATLSRTVIHGTPAEMAALREELRRAVRPRLADGEGRDAHVLGLVLVPER